MKGVAIAMIVIVAMVQFMEIVPSEAITCGQVTSSLSPCIPYLLSGGTPSSSCCGNIKTLNGQMGTKQDRQTACNCLKSAASNYPNIKPDAASNLPSRCGVHLPVPISPTTNCNTIP